MSSHRTCGRYPKKVKASWGAVFKDSGITGAELERLRTCFIACDEAIQQPEADAI
jgi:hypothetical protein